MAQRRRADVRDPRGRRPQHLRKKDYGAFQRATGTSVGELLAGLRGCDANATRDGATLPHEALPVVMSTKKVVPHPLNARGLQAFRALLAIRIMADAVRDSAPPGDAAAAWRATLLRDGVVAEAYDPPGGRLLLPAAIAAKFEALFRRNFSTATAGGWERAVTAPNDKQHYLHVDTYLPTYKAWIFLNVTVEDGPFAYVRGSHHASVPKLRWLFERTRHLTSTRAMPRASPHFTRRAAHSLKRRSATRRRLRFPGADPDDAAATAAALRAAGFERPTLLTGSRALAVVADVGPAYARASGARPRPDADPTAPVPLLPRLPRPTRCPNSPARPRGRAQLRAAARVPLREPHARSARCPWFVPCTQTHLDPEQPIDQHRLRPADPQPARPAPVLELGHAEGRERVAVLGGGVGRRERGAHGVAVFCRMLSRSMSATSNVASSAGASRKETSPASAATTASSLSALTVAVGGARGATGGACGRQRRFRSSIRSS